VEWTIVEISMDSTSRANPDPGQAAFYRSTVVLVLIVAAALLGFFFSNPAASPMDDALAASSRHRCMVAQADLHTLELGGRVYIVDEGGERAFREDADRPVAIELAKARIARYCR